MKNKNVDKAITIINDYRLFLKNNYSVVYNNRNYFFNLLKSLSSFKLNVDYINREKFKKKLSFLDEKNIRKIVDDYFQKVYNINTTLISYTNTKNLKENSGCYIEHGEKNIKLNINNNIQDCLIMAHEFRHYLNMSTDAQSYIQSYLTETLSIFEEINISNYIKKEKSKNIVLKDQNEEINTLLKMIYVKNQIIAEKNLCFFKLDQVITEEGTINEKKKLQIYLDEKDFNKNILEFLQIYKNNELNIHTMIWYNIGTLLAVLIKNNIKTKKINYNDIERFNKSLINSADFSVLTIIKVDLNDWNTILNNYKKELESLF